ncbi:hypothetical protein D3C81_1755340 [compost metagenome]
MLKTEIKQVDPITLDEVTLAWVLALGAGIKRGSWHIDGQVDIRFFAIAVDSGNPGRM